MSLYTPNITDKADTFNTNEKVILQYKRTLKQNSLFLLLQKDSGQI